MSSPYKCLRGMRDLSLAESERISWIERQITSVCEQFGYRPIHFPILESTALFQKSIGIETDIIGSEMYHFTDKNGDEVALRPEGTAGCLRACLHNGIIQRSKQKLYYNGPMFRRERPQMGRYRQFQQFGVEVFGYPSGLIDSELVILSQAIFKQLGLSNLQLLTNYLGSPNSRQRYRETLQDYWSSHHDALTEAEQQRAQNNPLRLLDSKNPDLAAIIKNAPIIFDYLTTEEQDTYQQILATLEQMGISYTHHDQLVRGLDYYSDFIFEWVSTDLGAQSTVCGGGRYDPLTTNMGYDISATGFAMGIDRLETLIKEIPFTQDQVYIATEDKHHLLPLLPKLYQPHQLKKKIYIDQHPGKTKKKLNQATQKKMSHLAYVYPNDIRVISLIDDQSTQFSQTAFIDWLCQLGAER